MLEVAGGFGLTSRNTSCIQLTTFPPSFSITSRLRDSMNSVHLRGRLTAVLALLYSQPSGSILFHERCHEWQVILLGARDRLRWINAGSCPGTWSVVKRGKNELSPASGRFQKASQAVRGCSKEVSQAIGDVSLPKVPESSISKPSTESCEGVSPQMLTSCATGKRIKEALFSRLGNERFAVWFGDNFEVHVSAAVAKDSCFQVAVLYDPNYPGDWLSKTFNEDVAVCASTILGGPVVVNWSPLEEVSSEVAKPADDTKELVPLRVLFPIPRGRAFTIHQRIVEILSVLDRIVAIR